MYGREARLANYKRENRRLRDNRELASPVGAQRAISVLAHGSADVLIARYEIARDIDFCASRRLFTKTKAVTYELAGAW